MVLIFPNTYRTTEILDETNALNRQTRALAKAQVKIWSGDEDVEQTTSLSPEDRLQLDRYIQGFLNALDDEVKVFYAKQEEKKRNTGELIPRWNSLVIWYNAYINRTFKNYLDSKISTSAVDEKLKIVYDMAFQQGYGDVEDIAKLRQLINAGVYDRIAHIYNPRQRETFEKIVETRKQTKKGTLKRGRPAKTPQPPSDDDDDDAPPDAGNTAGLLDAEAEVEAKLPAIKQKKGKKAPAPTSAPAPSPAIQKFFVSKTALGKSVSGTPPPKGSGRKSKLGSGRTRPNFELLL